MTIDAIKGNSPEQNALIGAGAAGAVGALGGYLFGGKRPSLEEVFAMPDDTFEAQTKDKIKSELQADFEKVKTAREGYRAGVDIMESAHGEAVNARTRYINSLSSEDITKAVAEKGTKKSALASAKVKVGDVEKTYKDYVSDYFVKNKAFQEAKKGLTEGMADDARAQAQQAIDKARNELHDAFATMMQARQNVTSQYGEYATASRALTSARTKAFADELAKEGSNQAKTLEGNVKAAADKIESAKTEMMNKIKENKEITGAFDKVKGCFDKIGRGKAIAWAAGILAVVGAVVGYAASQKKDAA